MSDSAQSAYDEVLYPSYMHSQTHPDRLATVAILFGMQPAPIGHCRVLELGCGDGGTLIPIAYDLADSELVGIDLAVRPIAKGREAIQSLGLKNIDLRQGSIMDVPADLGQFDYIIAHGVYSWIPTAVQDKLMAVCRANLAPNGVAYVSYNTLPGCHLREMVRQMLLYHVRDVSVPQEKIDQAVALIRFLAESQVKPDSYRQLLKEELEQILEHGAPQLFHDELAEINTPAYFHQFMAQAARHGLQYLGEADFYEMQDHIYTPQTTQALNRLANDRLTREQYLDFLKCRRFRQTLLCHHEVTLDPSPKPGAVARFHLSSAARPVSPNPAIQGSLTVRFEGKRGAAMETDFPLAKAAMQVLSEVWPQAISFGELLEQAAGRSRAPGSGDGAVRTEDVQALCEILFRTYSNGLVELHLHVPHYAKDVSEKPAASPIARWQAQNGENVTTLRHLSIVIEDQLGRHLLTLLDGTRERAALLRDLSAFIRDQAAAAISSEKPAVDIESALAELPSDLDNNLRKLARLGLLVA